MSNVSGQAYSLTVLTPLLADGEAALRAHFEQLPGGRESPFWKLGTTHFVRWVIIDQLVYEGQPQLRDTLSSPYLLFTAVFDGSLDVYLDALCSTLAPEVEVVWGKCVGFPGTHEPAAFSAYFRHNQIDSTFFYAAYPQVSEREVVDALNLRERFIEFAVRAQELVPAGRQYAFRASFPSMSGQ